MRKLRFAMLGAGFWARYQLAAWRELPGATCVAICNRTRAKAEQLAREFGVPAAFDDSELLFERGQLDFVDVVTHPFTLAEMVNRVAAHGLPVITQKPMAPSLAVAAENLRVCREAKVPYFVHENWRWQPQLRELKNILDRGAIGTPFRARITMVSGFPVFVNEPHLKNLEEFILTDMGTHVLDLARFYFGEAQSLCCRTHRVNPDIKGEDVATVMMSMGGGTTVTVEMGYAQNPLEHDCFPQTMVFVEGDRGSAEVARDYWVRVTTKSGTHARRIAPVHYSWADPSYDVVHASIVSCHANLLGALRGEGAAETTGEDNYKTLKLVYAAYDSARSGNTIRFADRPAGADISIAVKPQAIPSHSQEVAEEAEKIHEDAPLSAPSASSCKNSGL